MPFQRGNKIGSGWKVPVLLSGGGAAPAALILDQFTDADGTALTSHTIAPTNTPAASWANFSGTWVIGLNKATAATYSSAICGAVLDSGVADCTISGVVNSGNRANGDDYGVGFVFRYINASNFWWTVIRRESMTIKLYQRTANVDTERASTSFTSAANTNYALQVVLNGESIVVTVDGGNSTSYGSASFQKTATKHGLIDVTLTSDSVKPTVDTFQIV